MSEPRLAQVDAGVLQVTYLESGPQDGTPVLLLHGFPYDVHAFDEVAPLLASAGCRVIVPWLRGYGPTRFRHADTPRSGQQAVLARDALDLMDALAIERAVLAGFDWGARSACIVSALWPQRVLGLVAGNGYLIQDIANANQPAEPELERALWYQYYFHSERGRAGLAQHRREIGKLLWRLWSPNWRFDDPTYERSAAAFDNPDFVDVAIHSYRHRYGLAPGDPAVEDIEAQLVAPPPIPVPTIVLHGHDDGVTPVDGSEHHHRHFSGRYERRVLERIGHALPQEAPPAFAAAVLALAAGAGAAERAQVPNRTRR